VTDRTRGKCRSCQAPVIWALTAAAHTPIPIDPDPVPTGNLVLEQHPKVVAPVAVFVTQETAGAVRYVSHFVTCPQAGRWRKP